MGWQRVGEGGAEDGFAAPAVKAARRGARGGQDGGPSPGGAFGRGALAYLE